MTSTEIAIASKIMIGSTLASAMYIGSEQLWPDPNSNELVEIEYLEGSGYQYIDTNIIPNNTTGIEVTTCPNTNNYLGQNDNYIVGLRDNTSNTRWCLGKSTSNDRCRIYFATGSFFYFGTDANDENRYYSYGTTFTLSLNFLNDNCAVDKGRSLTSISSSLSFTPKNVIRIFGASGVNADYTKYSGKIYSVRISQGDQIVLDLIPVRRGNVGYMLDKITGTLYGNTGTSNFILGPDVQPYSLRYFTIESLEDSNIIRIEKNGTAPNISLSYSTNNGTTWTDLTASASIDLTTIDIGDKIIFKGTNSTLSSKYNAWWRFAPSKNFNVYGNAMSLLFGDNFINNSEFSSGTTLQLNGLFYNTATLINAKNLILPATTLANRSYYRMFQNCTSLTTAPELPATTLADYCYYAMFYGCTSLVTAPELPATTLADHCYYSMFSGCTLLNHVKALFTTDISSASNYTNNWLNGVAATGTFIKNKNATWSRTGASGIPSRWTVETYVES